MSIDHGKLLALADEISATVDHCSPSSTLRHEWAERLRALAQPAEAVGPLPNWCRTCGRYWGDKTAALFCRNAIHTRSGLSGADSAHSIAPSGGISDSGVFPDRDAAGSDGGCSPGGHGTAGHVQGDGTLGTDGLAPAAPSKHDAAQGAVAWMNKHGSVMTDELKQEFLATGGGFHVGAAGYDQPLYTHPQAAPAQWDDTRRLDWLDTQRQDDVGQERNGDPYLIARVWTVYEQKETIREAIDEAMTRAAAPSQEGES